MYEVYPQATKDDFTERVLLHLGRGMGEYVERGTYYDLTTCKAYDRIRDLAATGGNLGRFCASCEFNDSCRYLYTRARMLTGKYKILITTIQTLEYFNPPADVLVVDELTTPPTVKLSKTDLLLFQQQLNATRYKCDALKLLVAQMTGQASDEEKVDLHDVYEEVTKLRRGEKNFPQNELMGFLNTQSLRISMGRTPDGSWVMARIPRLLPLSPATRVLYLDATPSPFASAVFLREPVPLTSSTYPWDMGVNMYLGSVSRAAVSQLGNTPESRFAAYLQNCGIGGSATALHAGVKQAHQKFYLFNSRGLSGGEGHTTVNLLASMYQIPPTTMAILTHLLLNTDSDVRTEWELLPIGKLPYKNPRRGESVTYPYPVLYTDREFNVPRTCQYFVRGQRVYTSVVLSALETLQLAGRAFSTKAFEDNNQVSPSSGSSKYNSFPEVDTQIVGAVPGLMGLVRWVTVHPFGDPLYLPKLQEDFRRFKRGYNVSNRTRERFSPVINKFRTLS